MSIGTPSISPSLLCDVCPNCGYSLQGLGSAGRCPECGGAYDQSQVILHGWARGNHESIANAKRSRLIWSIAFPLVYCLIYFQRIGSAPAWFLFIGALTIIGFVEMIFRRKDNGHRGLVQVRLSDQGCVQVNNLGRSALNELVSSYAWIFPVIGLIALIMDWRSDRISPVAFWFWSTFAVVAEIPIWQACRRFRKAVREAREGCMADFNAALLVKSRWNELERCLMTQLSPGTHRLRIKKSSRFFTIYAVDAEISCSSEQALEIEDLIKTRIARARENNRI